MYMRRLMLALWCLLTAETVLAEDVQYTFRPGDSLWRVCENFARDPNQCWKELAQYNGISSPRAIPPGAILNIPTAWLKQAPEPARVHAVIGDVTLYRKAGGEAERVTQGAEVHTGDALETGDSSSVRVLFADQSELLVKPESLVIFDRYSRFQETGMVDTNLRLERGELRTYVRPRTSGSSRFIIVTPSAAAAVRGTRFDVEVDQEEVTRNSVLDGTVALSAQGQTQQVEAGFSSTAAPGEPPSQPVPLLPATTATATTVWPQATVTWVAVEGAERYWVELFNQEDGSLLRGEPVELPSSQQWQASLEAGDYALVVRAVDASGVRGYEATAQFTLVEPAPEPVVAAPVEEKKDMRGLWLFLVGAALMLGL
jgi:hypothetical protein